MIIVDSIEFLSRDFKMCFSRNFYHGTEKISSNIEIELSSEDGGDVKSKKMSSRRKLKELHEKNTTLLTIARCILIILPTSLVVVMSLNIDV